MVTKNLAHVVRDVRLALDETTTVFGERFAVSRRTVEDWEQGRHAPRGLAGRAIETLAREVFKARKAAKVVQA